MTASIGYDYLKLADQVAARIRSGELAPGAQLPNERSMGVKYGVSTGTVRRALDEMRLRGLVLTLPAKGSFVAPRSGGGNDGR